MGAGPRRMGRRRGAEGGYVLVLALVLMTALTVLGVTAVTTSNIDLRITQNLRQLEQARYASMAGGEHARRMFIMGQEPTIDQVAYFGDDDPSAYGTYFIDSSTANDLALSTVEGEYQVKTVWLSCGGAPAGYSLDKFHASFFDLWSEGYLTTNAGVVSPAMSAQVTTVSTLRRVMEGPCFMR